MGLCHRVVSPWPVKMASNLIASGCGCEGEKRAEQEMSGQLSVPGGAEGSKVSPTFPWEVGLPCPPSLKHVLGLT